MLQPLQKASDVRQHFSEFVDAVIRERPGFFQRNRDMLAAFNLEHLAVLLEPIELHASVQRDLNGAGFSGFVHEIDEVRATEASAEAVLDTLARDLTAYAQSYLGDRFVPYFHGRKRRAHFPYVLKVALLDGPEAVRALLEAHCRIS